MSLVAGREFVSTFLEFLKSRTDSCSQVVEGLGQECKIELNLHRKRYLATFGMISLDFVYRRYK